MEDSYERGNREGAADGRLIGRRNMLEALREYSEEHLPMTPAGDFLVVSFSEYVAGEALDDAPPRSAVPLSRSAYENGYLFGFSRGCRAGCRDGVADTRKFFLSLERLPADSREIFETYFAEMEEALLRKMDSPDFTARQEEEARFALARRITFFS